MIRLLRIVACCVLVLTTGTNAALAASCTLQSRLVDYCGPENNASLAAIVPDRLFGPFAGACEAHDVCYLVAGNTLVRAMEQAYAQTMLSATNAQKTQFTSQRNGLKSQCDSKFASALSNACKNVGAAAFANCMAATGAYYLAVRFIGDRPFNDAWDKAFTCRI